MTSSAAFSSSEPAGTGTDLAGAMRYLNRLLRRRATVAEMVAAKLEPLPGLLTVTPATPVRMAVSTLSSHHVSQLPVVVDGECIGSVAERVDDLHRSRFLSFDPIGIH